MWASRASVPRFLAGAAIIALIASFAVSVAPAATLDQQTCDQMKTEIGQLEAMGARENLAKGAAWGKANLRSAQLEQVKKLIEMDEAVAFRCPRPKPQPDPAAAAAVPAKGKAAAKGGPKAKSAEEKVLAKPKPRPKTKAQPEQGSPDGNTGNTAQAKSRPKAPQAPPPRPPSDAFTPPPKAAPAQ